MKNCICIYYILFCYCSLNAQNDSTIEDEKILKNIIFTLASDSLKGRESGTLYEKKSLKFISDQWETLVNKKLKKQTFTVRKDFGNFKSSNGYCFIDNNKKQTLLIGAHYDHIGIGGKLSMCANHKDIHNGADDNASGVALSILLAHHLKKIENLDFNFLFVFYSSHEIGLYGSTAFSNMAIKKKSKFKNIKLSINLDMVGRMDKSLKRFKCVQYNLDTLQMRNLSSIVSNFNLNIIEDKEMLLKLDTRTYVEKNMSTLHFTSGRHNDYHCPSDDAVYINFEGIYMLEQFILKYITKSQASHIKF